MKIRNIPNNVSAHVKTRAGNRPAPSFDGILKKAIEAKAIQSRIESPSVLTPAAGIPFDDIGGTDREIKQVETLLDALEEFEKSIANTESTTLDTSRIVSRLEEETNKLIPLLDTIHENELRDILNRALVISTVETIKFKRGDYL